MPDDSLPTAVIVGVGASNGLGAALCRRFAAGGLHVFVAGRTADRIERVADELRAAGGAATAYACDATDEANVTELFAAADRQGAGLRVAVFNAGNNVRSPLLEMSAELFERTWRVACHAGFLSGREAARRMLPRGEGTILFTGATASLRGKPPFTAFASAKAGLRALAQAMAREFGPEGLHVGHVIIDGGIDGEKLRTAVPDIIERRGTDGLLQPDDIAAAFWQLHEQPRSAWSFELDLRPYKERF